MIRPEQIANAKFTPVSAGSYSAEEVDSFLASVAEAYADMQNQNNSLVKKISILAEKVEEYRTNEEAIKNALLDAHKLAETVNKDASAKASAVISDAEAKAKEISDNASKHADELANAARTQAGDIVNNARTAVASLTERAQKEADDKVAAAKAQAEEIVGESKAKYEYYTEELKKVKAEMNRFKAMVEQLCADNNIDFRAVMPAVSAVERTFEKADAVAESAAPAAAEEPVAPAAVSEPEPAAEPVEEETVPAQPEQELDIPVFNSAPEAPAAADEPEEEEDELKIPVKAPETDEQDDIDDLFALFEEESAAPADFASDIDGILPEPAASPQEDIFYD
jgi:DivIVA domain-containing protein